MRSRLRSVFAVIAGVALVTSVALGGAMMQNPRVDSVEEASGQYVGSAEGQVLVATGAGLVAAAAAGYAYDEYIKNEPSTSAEELAKADALETKQEIYDQASIQKQNNELTQTAYSNYLNDTESIALMHGKNAYVRALENGSAESVARNRATEAVADYYSVKQNNLIAAYNVSYEVMMSGRSVANSTSDVSADYVRGVVPSGTNSDVDITRYETARDITLVNSSTEVIPSVRVFDSGGNGDRYGNVSFYHSWGDDYGNTVYLQEMVVDAPNSNFDQLTLLDSSELRGRWTEIEDQNSKVQSQLDTFIDNTYDSYQQGDISESDLVDPYLGMREYSPENGTQYQSWALRSLSALGINAPENLSSVGRMNVSAGGDTYTGILMSDENPAGGFTVGSTYNVTNLNGSQFVALDGGGAVALEGEFTLESATTSGGETIAENESVTYNNVTYETASTEEFKELQNRLDALTEQINERQQNLRAGAGGSGISNNMLIALVVLAGVALLVNRDN